MRVGLMAPGFSPRDAVGNDLFGMFRAFTARGTQAMIFTPNGEADFPLSVMHYADAPVLLGLSDVMIYHYCVADPVGLAVLRRLTCRILVRYHNVTPASLMSRWSHEFGRTCKLGRTMLAELPEMAVDGFLAASAFNAGDLFDLGIEVARVHVVPPLHRCDELLGQPAHPPTERLMEAGSFNVLAVGRLVPNKGFEVMMESFGKALTWGNLDIRLHHVGSHDARLQKFTDRVGEILEQYGVRQRFTFHGQVNPDVLATLYRYSDLFWTTSLHEGFCVPAVEAMAFGLPILSSPNAALPETCGDAAVYGDGTDRFAVRLHELLTDDAARVALGRTARARYESHFRPGSLRDCFLNAFDAVLDLAFTNVSASSCDHSGDWFGLPRLDELLEAALPLAPERPVYGLNGQDRRKDLVDWALRKGPAVSERLFEYSRSPELVAYAREIEMPRAAAHFTPALRLLWTFHRPTHALFDLQSFESAAAFWLWSQRNTAGPHSLGATNAELSIA